MVDRVLPFGYYSIHFRSREGFSLKKIISLILFVFLASGCGSMHRLAKETAEPPSALIDARLASIIIPDSMETAPPDLKTSLEQPSNARTEAGDSFLPK